MKVIIDGITYVPVQEIVRDGSVLEALEVRMDSDAGENITVRQYLHKLLDTLWTQGEGFSGTRPFGNSGWEYELYTPLVKAGFVSGEIDDDGYLGEFDHDACNLYIHNLISAVFFGVSV